LRLVLRTIVVEVVVVAIDLSAADLATARRVGVDTGSGGVGDVFVVEVGVGSAAAAGFLL